MAVSLKLIFGGAPHPNYDLGPILAFDGPELGCYKTDTLDYCSESEKLSMFRRFSCSLVGLFILFLLCTCNICSFVSFIPDPDTGFWYPVYSG